MAREDQPRRLADRSAHRPARPMLALGVALVSSALVSGLSIHQPGAVVGPFRAAAPAGHPAQAADIARSAPGQVPVPADVGRPTGAGLEAIPPVVAGPPPAGLDPNLAVPVEGVTSEAPPPAPAASLAESLLASLAPVRVPKPAVLPGPRRVGLQAGHWLTQQVPEELRRLEHSTGASWGGITETQLNLDIANRVAARLREHGYVVDILPTTIPKAYLADVFVSLHADGDVDGSGRGFKAAHGSRRGPYEDQLVRVLSEEYGRVTGLPVDPRVSRNMLGYYAFSWSRFESTVAPHTPAAILEMGFLTNRTDRELLLGDPDRVATGVAAGVLRFLHEVPTGAAFAEDLIVTPLRPRPTPAAS